MPVWVARLSRIFPLIALLVVAAVVLYAVVAWRSGPNRAKEVLIRVFTVIGAAICAFFLLAAAYAAIERNWTAVEIAFTFGSVGLVALVVARICRWRFVRNHPAYKDDAVQAEVVNPPLWQRIVERLVRSLRG